MQCVFKKNTKNNPPSPYKTAFFYVIYNMERGNRISFNADSYVCPCLEEDYSLELLDGKAHQVPFELAHQLSYASTITLKTKRS